MSRKQPAGKKPAEPVKQKERRKAKMHVFQAKCACGDMIILEVKVPVKDQPEDGRPPPVGFWSVHVERFGWRYRHGGWDCLACLRKAGER